MTKQVNYNNIKLLNQYDLINKLNLKSIYEIPTYKAIELKAFLKNESLIKVTQNQVEISFFFYLLGFSKIYLDFNYLTGSYKRSRSIIIESTLKTQIIKKMLLDCLFYFYIIVHKTRPSFVLSKAPTVVSKRSGKPKAKCVNLISYLPTSSLIEQKNYTIINFTNIKTFIRFEISQPIIYYSSQKQNKTFLLNLFFFKNIFPFWVFI